MSFEGSTAESLIVFCYRHLLVDGYTMVKPECCGQVGLRQCPAVAEWRKELRERAKLDRIKLRTIVSPIEGVALAVRFDWTPDERTQATILRESGVHVCDSERSELKLSYRNSPFCPECGVSLEA